MLICNERRRWTQEREPAHAKQNSDMKFINISRYDLGRTDLFPDFCGDGLYDVPPTHVDKFSFIKLWIFVFISAQSSIKHHIFLTLLTLDNYRYQTRNRNIMKFDLLIPKHLVIQLVKLQIDILKINTTFWHCKKIRLLLNKRVSHITLYPLYRHIKMCFHKTKSMYGEKMLLRLWWVDTFMVCCYIYKNLWRP